VDEHSETTVNATGPGQSQFLNHLEQVRTDGKSVNAHPEEQESGLAPKGALVAVVDGDGTEAHGKETRGHAREAEKEDLAATHAGHEEPGDYHADEGNARLAQTKAECGTVLSANIPAQVAVIGALGIHHSKHASDSRGRETSLHEEEG
jgi:hypothetical protein